MGSFFGIVNQTVNSDIKQWKKTEKINLNSLHVDTLHAWDEFQDYVSHALMLL